MPTRRRLRTTLVSLAVAAAVAAGATALDHLDHAAADKQTISQTGRVLPVGQRPPAPVLDGRTLTGGQLTTRQWAGDVIVVNFWGSWCAPCRKEAPVLKNVSEQTYARGVRFVGVDVRDTTAAGLSFERAHQIGYPSFDDQAGELDLRFHALAPQATPSTYVFDRRGRIAAVFFGAVTYDQLDSAVELVLEKG